MIKLLQHLRDRTASPDTGGVATAVFNAWQSPEAKKADVSAPDATKPRASSLQNTLLRGLIPRVPLAPTCARARHGHVTSRLRDNLGVSECHT
jgi:hypothetical protein